MATNKISDFPYVQAMCDVSENIVTWNKEGKIFVPETMTNFTWLERHIGRSWEKLENLKALAGPHSWTVFKALKAQYRDQE